MSDPHLLPQYQHELLAAIDPADGVVLMEPSPEERQVGYGLIVGVKRYEPEPHLAFLCRTSPTDSQRSRS